MPVSSSLDRLDSARSLRFLAAVACLLVLTATLGPASIAAAQPEGEDRQASVMVIVRATAGMSAEAEEAVESLGGNVGRDLRIINGFVARVPASTLTSLRGDRSVIGVTPDGRIHLNHHNGLADPGTSAGSSYDTTRAIGANKLWDQGITGRGVDVAMIDTGVAPVDGLRGTDKVIHGPDFSWESQAPNLRYLDTYGHGTHMAGLIAGRETAARSPYSKDTHNYVGVAPDARVVSVKVADAKGLADVSQVIAGIDWVIRNRKSFGMNIRVLNLSFGTDSSQTYLLDPLSFAVEKAWHKGIVVVVAAGNSGYGDVRLNNPAFNPYVIAVGADDTKGTLSTTDDTVPEWSTSGNAARKPDVVAPGKSLVSFRTPGSYIDQTYPEGRLGELYFRGSGTSQSAAVTSGAVALLLQHRPGLSPNQVKKTLMSTSTSLRNASSLAQGKGLINLPAAKSYSSLLSLQLHVPSTGLGSLNGSRGTNIISSAGQALTGEKDILGSLWLLKTVLGIGEGLLGGLFNGKLWAGVGFVVDPVVGLVWSTGVWGNDWTGNKWTDESWTGSKWTGSKWTGSKWTGSKWTGSKWTGDTWSSAGWGSGP